MKAYTTGNVCQPLTTYQAPAPDEVRKLTLVNSTSIPWKNQLQEDYLRSLPLED